MAQRRFGPTQGAGVAVVEKDAEKPIQPASLGVTAYVGVMEKGPVNKLMLVSSKKDFLRKAGSYVPESLLPDCAFDFFNLGNGAGELWLKRITDGSEVAAEMTLLSKHSPIRKPVLKIMAANGGRWGGKKKVVVGEYTAVTANTLSTGKTMKKNELKGAFLRLSAVAGKSYKVLSNSVAGILTFATDVDLVLDIAGSTNELYSVELLNDGKEVSVKIMDGQDNPTTEFGMDVYVDGVRTLQYPNLSMDPESPNYVEKVINDDGGNYEIKVEDLNTGTVSADLRPANFSGLIKTVTATVLTADIHSLQTSSPGGAVAVLATPVYGGSIKKDTITLTCTTGGATAVFSAVSALQGALANVTEGTAYTMNEYGLNFTLNKSGVTNFALGDVVTIYLDPFPVNGFIGQTLIPDYVNNRRVKFVIESNTVNSITVKVGSDMTTVAASPEKFVVEALSSLGGGYDGLEDLADVHYINAYDPGSSLINTLRGKNKGLVKIATPGVTATAVQKAGAAYAESRNYQYRYEIPANIVDEQAVEEYLNSTLGRNDFAKASFPSYAFVSNPLGAGNKLVSLTGSIHGREAKVANDYQGYHKVAAGIDVTLPNVVALPVGLQDKVLDEEFLNPVGVQIIKFKSGNAIMWGARTLAIDSNWKFAQHRETMSYYENTFLESFDYIIFAINDATARERLKASFTAFFLPEYQKGAIRGSRFDEAVSIKIDDENNTNLTMANGDLNAEIKMRLADTVERFVITMSRAGVFESLA